MILLKTRGGTISFEAIVMAAPGHWDGGARDDSGPLHVRLVCGEVVNLTHEEAPAYRELVEVLDRLGPLLCWVVDLTGGAEGVRRQVAEACRRDLDGVAIEGTEAGVTYAVREAHWLYGRGVITAAERDERARAALGRSPTSGDGRGTASASVDGPARVGASGVEQRHVGGQDPRDAIKDWIAAGSDRAMDEARLAANFEPSGGLADSWRDRKPLL